MTLTVRVASSREDMLAIYGALEVMQSEISRAPADPPKAQTMIARTIRAGLALVVEEEGKVVGTWGFEACDWWFSQEQAFFSKWFYVNLQNRYSQVTRLMLEAVVDLVEDRGIPAFIHVYEGGRGHSDVRKIGIELGFLPTGRIMVVDPKKED